MKIEIELTKENEIGLKKHCSDNNISHVDFINKAIKYELLKTDSQSFFDYLENERTSED